MKTLVLYYSNTGFTQKYAKWIAEELSVDIVDAKQSHAGMLFDYDTIIYGGGLYASHIGGLQLIIKNLDRLKGKKIIVFTTGASPAKEETTFDIQNKNFTPQQQQIIRFYYLRGGFDYSKLKPIHKLSMNAMKFIVKNKKEINPEIQQFLDAYDNPVDFTDKENIRDLLAYARA